MSFELVNLRYTISILCALWMSSWQILLRWVWSERNVSCMNLYDPAEVETVSLLQILQGRSDIECVESTGTCLCPKNNCHSNIFLCSTLLTTYCLIFLSHFPSDGQKEGIASQVKSQVNIFSGHRQVRSLSRSVKCSMFYISIW